MTQLTIPRLNGLRPAPTWLQSADQKAGEVVFFVLRAEPADPFGRSTRLHPADRAQRKRMGFSWRSAWLGALSALGLVGGLAAAAEATQPDSPIRIALPPARPAGAPVAFAGRAGVQDSEPGRSSIGPIALPSPALLPDTPGLANTKPAAKLAKVSTRGGIENSGEFFRSAPIQAAAQRAILSGVAQTWTFGGLTGVVVAGPLDLQSDRACHRIALWAENRPDSGDSMGFTSCLNDHGDWKTPAGSREEPLAESVERLMIP